jgi:5-(carboxyamino)imidazole ribonucleotide synthase
MTATKPLTTPVPPGGTIGILGGGQLGRMLAMAAARLGLKAHIYSDTADAPAFQVAHARTLARYEDREALAAFADACDAVTYEFENVPADAAHILSDHKPTHPNAHALAVAQDRLEEKSFVRDLGLMTASFGNVESADAAHAKFLALGGGPAILKTRRMGYDGKGQAIVKSADEAADAFKRFDRPCILEGFVDFVFEASVIGARALDGRFAAYDPPHNIHENHILKRSIVPAPLSGAQADAAKAIAGRIADALGYVGVLGVELFVAKDGPLLVNEIAPRVHNSGHWTLEACVTSQFEQHVRCVAGWPLGDATRHSDAVMENIIGAEAADWRALAASGGALHLYGKREIREGRKMGHVTRLSPKTSAR